MTRKIIRNGTILSPQTSFQGDVLIEDETFTGISVPNAISWEDAQQIEASGCYILPGVVDAHTHIQLDTGVFQTDDDWKVGTKSAAYGGVTTVVDFATQFAGQSFREALDNRLAESQPAYIDYSYHMMVTDLARDPQRAARDLAELRDMGIPSIKLYTTYKPNYYADDALILHTLRAMPDDMLALFHCENNDMVEDATARLVEEGKTGWRYHGQSRPPTAETEAALRVAHLAQVAGKAVYIVHCSAYETVRQLKAFQHETPLYWETCIQYLWLDENRYESDHPEHYILQPPLRHADNLSQHLNAYQKGEIFVLSTDHCDYSLAKKTAQDDFRVTAGGLPGLETLLPLSFTLFSSLADENANPNALNKLVEVLSANPAKLFGLYPKKGVIQPGSSADLVIYDPRPEVVIKQANLHTIGGYCPYEGMRVQGKVQTTISRGEVLMHQGEFFGKAGRGQFVPGKPFTPLED